jgi:hypothetical protein
VTALALLFAATMAAASPPPFSAETHALVTDSPGVASPLEGYLTVGTFFFRHARYERAKQVFAYGLLYAPRDPRFLGWLAATEQALGHADFAREYALAALAVEPSEERASAVIAAVGPVAPRPSPAASPSPASPSPGASPGASPAPAGSASPSPSASPAAGVAVVQKILETIGAPDKKLSLKPPSGPRLDAKLKGDRLMALSVLKTVDAALKIYKLNHPKDEMKELDLKKLVADKALPPELDLSVFPAITLADGKLKMEAFGDIEALEGELKEYRDGLDRATRLREKGLISEAHAALDALKVKFGDDPVYLERLLTAQMELGLEFPGTETARSLFLAAPHDPRHLYTLAVLYFRSSRPEKARVLADLLPRAYPDTFYSIASVALVRLIDTGVTHALVQKLLAEKDALVEPSPEPAASPSPAASASPAASPSASPSPAAR